MVNMKRLRCNDCGLEFEGEMGGDDSVFEIYRCDECDRVLRAERIEGMAKVLEEPCGCGGRYWKGRPPKCPGCRSQHISVVQ